MKKFTLLLICAFYAAFAFGQTTVTIYASGTAGSYTTGSAAKTASVTTRSDGTIAVSNAASNMQRGYAVFDLSGIPAGSTVTSVVLGINVFGYTAGTYGVCKTYGWAGSLATVTNPTTLYNNCGAGDSLWRAASATANGSYGSGTGDVMLTDTVVARTFIQSHVGGQVSISFSGGGNRVYNITGETGTLTTTGPHAPYLQVTYTVPTPCSGTPAAGFINASVSSACVTTTVSLTHTGTWTSSGITRQWQSSPDSSSWSNIPGATSATYGFTGLTSTTYYRTVVTCAGSGLSSYTAGKKISYTTVCACTGTPAGGTALASTTYCSACSLTLDLAGHATDPGITYQWQRSDNGTTGWIGITGATTVPYTFSPTGAHHYRCRVTCSGGGQSFSSPVFVDYRYRIIDDSVRYPADTVCSNPKFYVKVNGTSALLRLKTYYGNGQKDSLTLIGSIGSATSYANANGNYLSAGYYTVKQVLYYNNIPQDSITFVYHQNSCQIFQFRFYNDANGNCMQNSGESNYQPLFLKIDSSGIPIDTVSVMAGYYYKAKGAAGTVYSFRLLPGSSYTSCPASGVITETVSATATTYPVKYVGLSCVNPAAYDLSVYAVIPVTAANMMRGTIYVNNTGCAAQNPNVTFNYSPLYTHPMGVSPLPASSGTGMSAWNFTGLTNAMGPKKITFTIRSVAPFLTIGSTVYESVIVTPKAGDSDTTNNHEEHTDTVTGPYDPNLIQVLPEGCFERDTQFQYTIHFENLGNDTAHNVAVMDTLSDYLDVNTLKMVMASAEMDLQVYKDGPYTVAKFDFPNINLLDSSKHGENDGAFIYTIKNKPGMVNGNVISNRVGIYFDYADVVLTNTVENTKGCPHPAILPVVTDNNRVVLYPNPVTNELTIKTEPGAYSSYTITNSVGQVLIQNSLSNAQTITNVSMLPPGMYYVTVRGDGGRNTMKFVKR